MRQQHTYGADIAAVSSYHHCRCLPNARRKSQAEMLPFKQLFVCVYTYNQNRTQNKRQQITGFCFLNEAF